MPTIEDVIIIGGGPAGSTAASYLARKGHRVVLFEKENFPREHVGESLLPFCYKIFDELGVLDQLKRRFVRKPGVRFIDSDGLHYTTWCFGHHIKDPSYLSFHVLRSVFDKILLDNSRRLGCEVHEGARVRDVELDGQDGTVKVRISHSDGRETETSARFLVDASGRDTFLAGRHNWKRPHKSLDRTALSTHWTGGKYVEGIEEGLLQIVYLGGDKQGWIWAIPLDVDRLSLGVVLNHAYIRKRKSELIEAGESDWQTALYRGELMSSPFIRDILSNAEIAQPLMVNGNYSYFVEKKRGDNYCLVGDAGAFIDPIFASGVYLALQSSKLVAEAIDKILGGESGDHLQVAYEQIDGAYALVDKAIRLFYNPDALNFAQVESAKGIMRERHETALAVGHYLLAGDFFANHEKYYKFFELLEDPGMLAKYKHLVIDRKDFQTTSCGSDKTEIFHELLKLASK